MLLATKDGKIEADLTLLPCSVPNSGKRVVLYAKTSDGKVVFKLACFCSVPFLEKKILTLYHDASTPSNPRRPISLATITSDAHILLRLPRSFRGPLLLKLRDRKVRFSDEVKAQITTF